MGDLPMIFAFPPFAAPGEHPRRNPAWLCFVS
jgi:hypothetical protein